MITHFTGSESVAEAVRLRKRVFRKPHLVLAISTGETFHLRRLQLHSFECMILNCKFLTNFDAKRKSPHLGALYSMGTSTAPGAASPAVTLCGLASPFDESVLFDGDRL